jgi:hypothetical protein
MARHHTARGEQRSTVSRKEFDALKREVERKSPIDPAAAANYAAARRAEPGERPDFLRVSRGSANYSDPVASDITRLKGRSRSDVVSDTARGARSPLGKPTKKSR